MKKNIMSLLLGLLMIVMLFSCSNDDEEIAINANIVGLWTVKSADLMLAEKSLDDYIAEKVAGLGDEFDEQYAEEYAAELADYMYEASVKVGATFEFGEDKTALITEQGHLKQGTWSVDGNQLTVTFEEDIPRTFEVRSISGSEASVYVKYDEERAYTNTGIDVTMLLKK